MMHLTPAALVLCSLLTTTALASQLEWVDQPPSIGPQTFHAMSYDAARERVVMFGPGQTWEWDGARWLCRRSNSSPGSLHYPELVYDAARRQTVLFAQGETWEWDGTDWRERRPVNSPSLRQGTGMAYDWARERVVLFGGLDPAKRSHQFDTWEWDGASWLQRSPATIPQVANPVMAYDTARARTVMFGQGQTWEWDGKDWSQRQPATNPGHWSDCMAYDAARQRVVLIVWGQPVAGVFEWDGKDWVRRSSARTPPAQFFSSMAYDEARREMIHFGGSVTDVSPALDPAETWAWDGTNWTQRHAGDGYESSVRGAAYDSRRQRFVSLGAYFSEYSGRCGGSYLFESGTREWDGQRWHHRTRGSGPTALAGHALAFDASRGVTVMFGGRKTWEPPACDTGPEDRTWEWDGQTWRQQSPVTKPPGRTGHSMVYDPARRRVVLFGGGGRALYGDTWEWDGTNWTQRQAARSPTARVGHAMAHDPVNRRTILHGGRNSNGALADTWEWDGIRWQPIQSPNSPPAASGHAMAWDPSRQKVVLYVEDQLWELHPSNSWALVAKGLPRANGGTMAFDTVRQALVVTGGGTTRLLGKVETPAVRLVGRGCLGSAGLPLISSHPPRLGDAQHRLVLDQAKPRAPTLFVVASRGQTTPLAGGCSLYLGGTTVTVSGMSSGFGHSEISLAIPMLPALRGAVFWAQAAVVDPNGAAGGFAVSAALRMTIGD